MYTDKIVACIKVNGKILREDGDTVTLPFGCEYSILIKNLDWVRSQVTVFVDGADATGQLVIEANGRVDLERFIRHGHLVAGNRFKFIERTPEIENHRGIGEDDGIIRIEARRERIYVLTPHHIPPLRTGPTHPIYKGVRPRTRYGAMTGAMHPRANAPATPRPELRARLNDAGITVPGSVSSQRFRTVCRFPLEAGSIVIILRLRGQIGDLKVEQPVTVDMKPECQTCGKVNSVASRFCARCGTALELIGESS